MHPWLAVCCMYGAGKHVHNSRWYWVCSWAGLCSCTGGGLVLPPGSCRPAQATCHLLRCTICCCCCRVKYEQTIGDIKAAVADKLGVPPEQQQLFWHKKELTASYDARTLLDMDMHTGFGLKGYDLVSRAGGGGGQLGGCCWTGRAGKGSVPNSRPVLRCHAAAKGSQPAMPSTGCCPLQVHCTTASSCPS
jgi:hypothetical protein